MTETRHPDGSGLDSRHHSGARARHAGDSPTADCTADIRALARSLRSGLQARLYQAWICYRKASARDSSEIAARSPGMVVVGAMVAPTRAGAFPVIYIQRRRSGMAPVYPTEPSRDDQPISAKVGCGGMKSGSRPTRLSAGCGFRKGDGRRNGRVAPSTVIRGADIVQLSSILSGTFRPGGRMAGAGRNSHVSRDINGLTWQMGVGNRCVVALKDLPMPRPGVRGIQCGGCRGRRQMTSRREAGGHGRNYLRDASGCLSQPGKSCATSWTAGPGPGPAPTGL